MKSTSNSGILDIIEYQKEQIKDLQNTKGSNQFEKLRQEHILSLFINVS
ncbi:Hypothetical protein NCDO2118_p0008 (plasmid) [Lactococcus lactis subsp. lactis NCDO 2118]|uniref:Uncharacterized protein n=1 Tax=Lactococcus lactis subsp. lactis NCDO 2118 TaxID=1117941 RepID=A0ABC8A9D7_LACLL|nr:Hypothetical protein NCDO2118_p0008 [Lactococcus lactis subsp. lactis NCDO 2118]